MSTRRTAPVLFAGSVVALAACTTLLGVEPVPDGDGAGDAAQDARRDATSHGDSGRLDAGRRDAEDGRRPDVAFDGPGLDASAQEVATVDGHHDGAGEAGPATCGGTCCVVYVSGGGDDHNSGCDSALPKQTIKAAVSAIGGAGGVEVHVCAGTYTETDLTLTTAISLRGAYDCTTWQREPPFVYPGFNTTNETLVLQSTAGMNPATLTVGPPSVADGGGQPFTIDGLTVRGASSAREGSEAMNIVSMTPTITNDVITGGAATVQTIALLIQTSAPVVTGNTISGTVDTTPTGTTYGLYVNFLGGDAGPAPGPTITGNTINGGNGQACATCSPATAFGSVGVAVAGAVDMTGATAFADNTVSGGTGLGSGMYGNSSIGVLAELGASLEARGNVVQGGVASAPTADIAATIGVYAVGARAFVLDSNRVYGGTTTDTEASTIGVVVINPLGAIQVVNNFVHGGMNASAGPSSAGAVAVECDGCPAPYVEDNTIFAGHAAPGGFTWGVELTLGTVGAVVRGNVLAGPDGSGDYGVWTEGCGSLAHFDDNAFVNQGTGLLSLNECPDGGAAGLPDIATLQSTLSGVATGNVRVASSCGARDSVSECLSIAGASCPSPAGCLGGLIAGWDEATYGVNSLGSAAGWPLAPGAPCAITQGGYDLSAATEGPVVTTDIFGALRPSGAPSIGAAQYVSLVACAPTP